jgi:hypothetical protein
LEPVLTGDLFELKPFARERGLPQGRERCWSLRL